MENDTVLDLNGKTLTVLRATLNGTKLLPGTYSATDAAVAGFVTDTAEGDTGSLVVSGSGTVIMLR